MQKREIAKIVNANLLAVYELPYGHLIFNNSNYWLKTSKTTIYKYPNIKVRIHQPEEPLKLLSIKEDNLYYRNILIMNADAVNEQAFLTYKFIKKTNKLFLEEYKIVIVDYFTDLNIFCSLDQYYKKIEELRINENYRVEKGTIIKRGKHLLLIRGSYINQAKNDESTLDFTTAIFDDTYFYNFRNKVIMYSNPNLKIRNMKRTRTFETASTPIVKLDRYAVYKKTTSIKNCVFADYYRHFYFVVNETGIFLIYKDLIIFKQEQNVIGGSIKRMVYYQAKKNVCEKMFDDFFFIFGLFYDYVLEKDGKSLYIRPLGLKWLRQISISKVEKLVVCLILSNMHKFVEPFLDDLFQQKTFETESFLSNSFRQLDDRNRRYFIKYVQNIDYVENYYKLIVYFPRNMQHFIKMAIKQKKEYYLMELINYYKEQKYYGKLNELRFYLLKNNCFYLYSECLHGKNAHLDTVKELIEIEKKNLRIQFNKDLYLK